MVRAKAQISRMWPVVEQLGIGGGSVTFDSLIPSSKNECNFASLPESQLGRRRARAVK